jgi:hypothetical protein
MADAVETASPVANRWDVSANLRTRAGITRPGRPVGLLLSIDSTIVRAHQHTAGAPANRTGARLNDKIPEPDDHGISRSRVA